MKRIIKEHYGVYGKEEPIELKKKWIEEREVCNDHKSHNMITSAKEYLSILDRKLQEEEIEEMEFFSAQNTKLCQTLKPGEWLDDEALNLYLSLLGKRDEEICKSKKNKRSHFFNSFFYTRMVQDGNQDPYLKGHFWYGGVQKWIDRLSDDIFALEKLFFPVHQDSNHWFLVVIFMTEKKIRVYNSLAISVERTRHYVNNFFSLLQHEHWKRKGSILPEKEKWIWEIDHRVPQQENSKCATFVKLANLMLHLSLV